MDILVSIVQPLVVYVRAAPPLVIVYPVSVTHPDVGLVGRELIVSQVSRNHQVKVNKIIIGLSFGGIDISFKICNIDTMSMLCMNN